MSLAPTLHLQIADPRHVPPTPQHRDDVQVVPLYRLPVAGVVDDVRFVSGSEWLPLRTASFQRVSLGPLLEFLVTDDRLIGECYRVLLPGGSIQGVVPNMRGLGVLDSINLMRYARDVIGHGPALPELAESGWRRHYAIEDLQLLLSDSGFSEIQIRSCGIASSELRLGKQLAMRWLTGELGTPLVADRAEGIPPAASQSAQRHVLGARLRFQATKP